MRLYFQSIFHSLILILTISIFNIQSFYLPGLNPHNYKFGDEVPLLVNALLPISSKQHQKLYSLLPYSYYLKEFHFCQPKELTSKSENLGAALFGDRIYNSPYQILMMKNSTCEALCEQDIPKEDAMFINNKIGESYAHDWLIDSLPVAYEKEGLPIDITVSADKNITLKNKKISIGFPIGEMKNVLNSTITNNSNDDQMVTKPFFFNHFDILIEYHTKDYENFRVVGSRVIPRSIPLSKDGKITCKLSNQEGEEKSNYEGVYLSETKDNKVQFTYSVTWYYSDTPWATRWDAYLKVEDSMIHWFSLIDSLVVVVFLFGLVALILIRTLRKDISRYNQIDSMEDLQEDFGWKLVHGDVFRTPEHPMLLSIMVGNGLQLLFMVLSTLGFAVIGLLSPSMRGSLVTAMVVMYMLFGSISGYTSSRLYKMMGGEAYKSNMLLTAILFPSIIFLLFIIINFFLIGSGTSAAVPFGTMFLMIALWFLISIPLSFIGSYIGFKKPKIQHPIRTNQIPRQIPTQPFYLKNIPTLLVGGLLPFSAIAIELYFIMNSIWFHRLYYVFGFLFLVFFILLITCAQVAILICYFRLCSEQYQWWWNAFFTSGATAFYVILLSIGFFIFKFKLVAFADAVVYFGWASIVAIFIFLITGAMGFLACLIFIRKIYASIKLD